jgi:hypothetical protein
MSILTKAIVQKHSILLGPPLGCRPCVFTAAVSSLVRLPSLL